MSSQDARAFLGKIERTDALCFILPYSVAQEASRERSQVLAFCLQDLD